MRGIFVLVALVVWFSLPHREHGYDVAEVEELNRFSASVTDPWVYLYDEKGNEL